MMKNETLEAFFSAVDSVCAEALPEQRIKQVRNALAGEGVELRIIAIIRSTMPGQVLGILYRPNDEPELLFNITPQTGADDEK